MHVVTNMPLNIVSLFATLKNLYVNLHPCINERNLPVKELLMNFIFFPLVEYYSGLEIMIRTDNTTKK